MSTTVSRNSVGTARRGSVLNVTRKGRPANNGTRKSTSLGMLSLRTPQYSLPATSSVAQQRGLLGKMYKGTVRCVRGVCRAASNRTRGLTNYVGITRKANSLKTAVNAAKNAARIAGSLSSKSSPLELQRAAVALGSASVVANKAASAAGTGLQKSLGNINRQLDAVLPGQAAINDTLGNVTGIGSAPTPEEARTLNKLQWLAAKKQEKQFYNKKKANNLQWRLNALK